jgi:predicted DNA-binding WGR domain protein
LFELIQKSGLRISEALAGTVRKEWFDSEEEAAAAGEKLNDAQRKKGLSIRAGE